MNGRTLVRISHRGGGSLAPENSVKGIETAIGFGVEMVEVDVRLTRDGALLLSHDPLAHGTTLPVAMSTLADLHAQAPGGIATVEDALDAAAGRVRLNLDVKDAAALEPLLAVLRARGTPDVIISCLEIPCLARAGELAPDIPRFFSYPPDYGGASSKPWLKPAVDATVALMRTTMHLRLGRMLRTLPNTGATIYYRMVTPRLVRLARRLSIELYTWTVDDPADMQRIVGMGVDGITSNRPDLLAELQRPEPAAVR
jgi:glycerophosphoryl diester phosphodiesterase